VSSATQIYYASFERGFGRLPSPTRRRIQAKIDELGAQLATFPHHQLKGSRRFRLRVGEYRIIYSHDAAENVLHLLAVGHRKEIYRV
jgi:mRNA interferase RelE/StbE